ncbi:hypothetical protein BCR35DRAFT_284055 [Leucosporidium creatinivorum]|uniref:Alkyl hydroperoxide reductase subunit C/ Thiol specific antioxidant domain-containing protein n=1 Tax=Leucosporidium creatinivorum TaxID=106004 RepID=A0A1Y2DCF4_9BASI|nr:hypothetical protein BCR35DRAFT_284055 [Leucosporidium creatinivorum]
MPPLWNDLISVLPTSHPPLSPLPTIGSAAPLPPKLGLQAYSEDTLIAFVRHCGCPFAESEVKQLAKVANEDASLKIVIVTMSDETAAREWFAAVGGDFDDPSRVSLIADPSRELYAAFGVGTLPWSGLFGTAMLGPLSELASKGIKNRATAPGSARWQNSATFAVAKGGEVKWVHVAEHAGDMSDMEAAARSLKL